ncbi:MAG: multiheme c-type cytochrome [Verrucomicrobiota bacterium]
MASPKPVCVLLRTLKVTPGRRLAIGVIAALAGALLSAGGYASAQSVQHLSITQPGGFPGAPVMTGIQIVTNGVKLTWDGPAGYYQVYKKGLTDSKWVAVGGRTNLVRYLTINGPLTNSVFKVLGPTPQYAGATACAECHAGIQSTELKTGHAVAYDAINNLGQGKNASCLPCHTVGYNLTTGFKVVNNVVTTTHLKGVQCESCHGPGGNHAANPDDPITRPRIEIAAEVCGGCHSGPKNPTFDEWKTTGHAIVSEDMNDPGRIETCGRCHSGSSRLAQLDGLRGSSLTNAVHGDANIGITCAVCHEPHRVRSFTNVLNGVFRFTNALTGQFITFTNRELGAVYTNQLRTAIASTKDFYLTTTDVLTNKFDRNINACAQCHNHRGASWTSTSRPPHHSPQYNLLLGTVGELSSGAAPNLPSTHSRIEQQCVSCHMETSPHQDGPPEVAAVTGHKFAADSYGMCAACHKDATTAQGLVTFAKFATNYRIQLLKSWLDAWALMKGPNALVTKYGARAWEYTTPGELSPGGSGPDATEQAQIPNNIKKARFNLYLVLHDGSSGIHNAPYSAQLLDTALTWVQDEVNQ